MFIPTFIVRKRKYSSGPQAGLQTVDESYIFT